MIADKNTDSGFQMLYGAHSKAYKSKMTKNII